MSCLSIVTDGRNTCKEIWKLKRRSTANLDTKSKADVLLE